MSARPGESVPARPRWRMSVWAVDSVEGAMLTWAAWEANGPPGSGLTEMAISVTGQIRLIGPDSISYLFLPGRNVDQAE